MLVFPRFGRYFVFHISGIQACTLTRKWAEECHAFSVKNGGKLVTKANFSEVFRRAWTASVTIENVGASFKATGTFPFNKNRFQFPEAEELLGRETEELPEARRKIAFLPFISPSPAKRTTRLTLMQKQKLSVVACCHPLFFN